MKQSLVLTLGTVFLSGLSACIVPSIALAGVGSELMPDQVKNRNTLDLQRHRGILLAQNRCVSSFYTVQTRDGDSLNLRVNPNLTAKVIGNLPNGTEVVANVYDRSGQWAEISAAKGVTGWVAVRYLTQLPVGSDLPTGSMRVKTLDGDRVNIRSQPSLNAKVLGNLRSGTVVSFIANEGYWTKIAAPNGTQGYVANQYLICD